MKTNLKILNIEKMTEIRDDRRYIVLTWPSVQACTSSYLGFPLKDPCQVCIYPHLSIEHLITLTFSFTHFSLKFPSSTIFYIIQLIITHFLFYLQYCFGNNQRKYYPIVHAITFFCATSHYSLFFQSVPFDTLHSVLLLTTSIFSLSFILSIQLHTLATFNYPFWYFFSHHPLFLLSPIYYLVCTYTSSQDSEYSLTWKSH